MGLLASHGLTHHLLRVARARWRRRLFSSSSWSIITMAATPIKMLKWASCCWNSRLHSIVTTAEMTGGSKVTDFYTCAYIWGGELTITPRSPAGGRQITQRWSTGNRTNCRHRPEIGGSPGGHRQEPWWWPQDRAREKWPFATYSCRSPYGCPPVIGKRSLTQLSQRFKVMKISRRPTDVQIWRSGKIPAKIGRPPLDLRCIGTSAISMS